MPTKARDIITDALFELGVIAEGEVPSAEQAQRGLRYLNRMLDSWSTSSLIIPYETDEELTVSTSPVALTSRPMSVIGAVVRDGGQDYSLDVYSPEQWWSIGNKSQAGRPQGVWWNKLHPDSSISLYPVPDKTYTLILRRMDRLTAFASLDAELTLPGEYERCLVLQLAIEMANGYGRSVSTELAARGQEALERIQRYNNSDPPTMTVSDIVGTIERRYYADWRAT